MMKQNIITIKFKADEDVTEEMACEIMQEIQERFMYVTEVNINDNKYFEFDENTYKGRFIKDE